MNDSQLPEQAGVVMTTLIQAGLALSVNTYLVLASMYKVALHLIPGHSWTKPIAGSSRPHNLSFGPLIRIRPCKTANGTQL